MMLLHMTIHRRFIPLMLLGALVGCGGDGVTPPASPSGPRAALQAPTTIDLNRRTTPASPAGNGAQKPAIPVNGWAQAPADARWTLFVMRFSSPGHAREASLYRDRLVEQTGRRDWVVVHEENQSVLYFGAYREIDAQADPVDGKRAQEDLKWFASMVDKSTGRRVFSGVIAQPIPLPDPPAPAEWNLALVDRDKDSQDPNRRYWSLVVAGYNLPGEHGETRKQLAVDSVRDLREKLNIEAYFYHGPSVSHVCIGAWKRSAIAEQDGADAKAVNPRDSVVVAPTQLPESLVKEIESHGDTRVQMPTVVMLDPAMKATLRDERFCYYALNGYLVVNRITDPHDRSEKSRPQPSFLVEIAGVQKSLISGSTSPAAETMEQAPSLLGPSQPQGGQLRRLGN